MTTSDPVTKKKRLVSIDLLRGIVMVLMVLDHARDFFSDVSIRPTDLEQTNVVLFFTRWVTHFCAPGFVFLAGTAIYLAARRRTPTERTKFLVTRGLFLVFLELTVVKIGWAPEPFYRFLILQVIWAIGWSMVGMAALTFLSSRWVGALGALALLFTPWWESAQEGHQGAAEVVLTLLTGTGFYRPAEGHSLIVGYAILPWLAVMMVGYGFGEFARLPRDRFRRVCLVTGATLTLAFFALRGLNLYGDPAPWSVQPDPVFTVLSFLKVTKYPPSLSFVLMTLGPLLIALGMLTRVDATRAPFRWLLVFGRVPLFYYVAHLWLLRFTSLACGYFVWGDALLEHDGNPKWPLAITYLAWALALLLLYRPSRWFEALKRRRNDWWLAYL